MLSAAETPSDLATDSQKCEQRPLDWSSVMYYPFTVVRNNATNRI